MEICMLRIMMMKEKIEKKNMHLLPSTEVLISLRASIVSENVCLHLKFEIPNSLCIHQRGDNDVIVLIIFLFNNEETYKFFGLWNSVKHWKKRGAKTAPQKSCFEKWCHFGVRNQNSASIGAELQTSKRLLFSQWSNLAWFWLESWKFRAAWFLIPGYTLHKFANPPALSKIMSCHSGMECIGSFTSR